MKPCQSFRIIGILFCEVFTSLYGNSASRFNKPAGQRGLTELCGLGRQPQHAALLRKGTDSLKLSTFERDETHLGRHRGHDHTIR